MAHPTDSELLLWIDCESDPRIQLHLNDCPECRARAAQLKESLAGLIELYRNELPPASSERNEVFRFKLAQRSGFRPAALAACAVAVALLVSLEIALHRSRTVALAYTPNLQLTPGAVSPVTLSDVCSGVFSSNDPAVPDPLKQAVFREYGLKNVSNDSYELDFLVTPQLGGAVSIRNLWPQPAGNARAKDQLEDRLHSLVCSGQVDLSTAQRELSQDWVAAYKKYFGTNQPHLAGTSRIRSSVASSTALRENGIG